MVLGIGMALGRMALVVVAAVGAGFAARPAVGAAPRPDPTPTQARRVAEADLPVRVEPSERAYATGRLARGAGVVVRRERDGWAEIDAPAETFLWVDADGVRARDDGSAVAVARRATLRYAAEGSDVPGPGHPLGALPGGALVREVDRPEVSDDDAPRPKTWRAIAPPRGEARFVRLDGLEPPDEPEGRPRARPAPTRGDEAPLDRAVRRSADGADGDARARPASFAPPPDDLANLPPAVVSELTAIDAEVRAIRARPIGSWDLEPIRGRYEALLRRFGGDAAVRTVVQGRLAATERDAAASRAAGDLDRLFRDGDKLDAEVDQARRRLAAARGRGERAFDATGLLQVSSRRYQGQKVHALIGPEGMPVGYVQIPPGVPVDRYLMHRVGIRGFVHYDQGLGTRLISARDLEILDKRR